MNIAVILPTPFEGGVVKSALNILRMLCLGARQAGDDLTLSFGYPSTMSSTTWKLDELESLGINVRPFKLQTVKAEALAPYFQTFIKPRYTEQVDTYCIFNDGISNFEEADLWLIISDHLPHLPPPHKPYGIIIYDFVRRYIPEIYNEEQWRQSEKQALMIQNACFAMTTTVQTKEDTVTYIGYPADRIEVFPVEFDPDAKYAGNHVPTDKANAKRSKQIMWPTIVSQHENHSQILDGLECFLARNSDYSVIVVGFHVEAFNPNVPPTNLNSYVQAIRGRISKSAVLRAGLTFTGYVEDSAFESLVRNAETLLHSSRFDNGSYTVIEAAWLGTPTLSARYAAMEEIADQFSIPITFFDIYNKYDFVDALEKIISDLDGIRLSLPPQTDLQKNSYKNLAPIYWSKFKKLVLTELEMAHEL